MKVPIFKLEYDEDFKKKYLQGVGQILDKGFLTNDDFVRKFEDSYRQHFSSDHFLAVSNGTSAIEVALKTIDVRGKKVFLPVNTFIATYVAVLNSGGIPILFDIENNYFGIDVDQVLSSISKDIGAVVVVHIGGIISPSVIELQRHCRDIGVPLVEDAAHAIGSTHMGMPAGTIGDFGAFSFFTTKVMSTGEGGGVSIREKKDYKKAYSLRQFGMSLENSIFHEIIGSNYKLSEFQALLGCLELERVNSRIKKRRVLAQRYQTNLSGSDWVAVGDPEGGKCSYYKQIVISPIPTQKIAQKLLAKGVHLTGKVYEIPLHQQKSVQDNTEIMGSFPVSDRFSESHICPPCYPEMTLEEVDYVCEQLLSFGGRS